MIPQQKLNALIDKFVKVEAEMATVTDSEAIIRLSKEHGELRDVVEKARELIAARQQLTELEELAGSDDAEMAALASDELAELKEALPALEQELQLLLIPKGQGRRRARYFGGSRRDRRRRGRAVRGRSVPDVSALCVSSRVEG